MPSKGKRRVQQLARSIEIRDSRAIFRRETEMRYVDHRRRVSHPAGD
jgi:hypothetical protein